MNQAGDYITEEKRLSLEEELADLKGPKRKEIITTLEYAKSLGDLSENAEYHQAREDQGKLEGRIAKIEQILKSSEVIVKRGGDIIEVGSKVVVEKADTQAKKIEKTYTIVGSEEADMAEGKISNRSPFGEALFGKKKGDKVTFMTPSGKVNYKIISVS
ncbi:MAG: transcription elongation factor GreA [Candidatus Paceibacterota bacterium]